MARDPETEFRYADGRVVDRGGDYRVELRPDRHAMVDHRSGMRSLVNTATGEICSGWGQLPGDLATEIQNRWGRNPIPAGTTCCLSTRP